MIPIQGRAYAKIVAAAAQVYRLPESLIWAVMGQESGFRPTAFRPEPKIADGSHGLMQLLLKTARSLGYRGEVGESRTLTGLYDPETNIGLGAKLLGWNYAATDSFEGAVSAYNGGLRKHLGFGWPATERLRVRLAWNEAKECIRWRDVEPGTFANQPYVTAVMARKEVYDGTAGPSVA